jgi:hypothetical protein
MDVQILKILPNIGEKYFNLVFAPTQTTLTLEAGKCRETSS